MKFSIFESFVKCATTRLSTVWLLCAALILGLALVLCPAQPATAQELDFERRYGAEGRDVAFNVLALEDRGLLIVGSTTAPSAGLADMYILRLDSRGDTVWTLRHGGFNNDEAVCAALHPAGGFVVGGYTGSFSNSASRDMYLIKISAGGALEWTKVYGGTAQDEANTITATRDGNFVLGGITQSFGAGNSDAYIVKVDAEGEELWSTTVGGPEFDDCWTILEADDGGLVFTGGTYSYAQGTEDDAWLVKLSADGTQEWRQTYGLPNLVDWAWSAALAADGGYILTGLKNHNPQAQPVVADGEMHIVKTDSEGNMLWDKSIANSGGRIEGRSVISTSDGGYFICGNVIDIFAPSTSFIAVKLDAAGDESWRWRSGNSLENNIAYRCVEQAPGAYIVVGSQGVFPSVPGNDELYVARILDATTSVSDDVNSADLSPPAWPQPAAERVNFKLPGLLQQGGLKLDVFDMAGRRVNIRTEFIQTDDLVELNITGLPPAAYVVHLQQGDEQRSYSFIVN